MIAGIDPPASAPRDFAGLRVLIFGLGAFGGGAGAARFFAARGARVSITDQRTERELAAGIAALADCDIAAWRLGEHREEDVRGADWLVVNPAVAPQSRFLAVAREAGVRVVTEVGLLLAWCRSRHIGAVTGSNGKSTTTKLAHDMLRASGFAVHMGGNIGGSLLPEVDRIEPEHRVVLELSSFQLERFDAAAPLPHAVAITQFAPNHLDWHGDEDAYLRAKERILAPRAAPDAAGTAVLPAGAREYSRWRSLTARAVVPFAGGSRPAGGVGYEAESAAGSRSGDLWLAAPVGETITRILPAAELALRGEAGRAATACAAGLALALGSAPVAIAAAAREFRALPHRQEPVARARGISFVNDSKATTPEATACALEAFAPNVILLAGGSSKGASFARLGAEIARRARAAVAYGA
ncbi:MAG: UDP-N-acetylmuramoyl-L-alanine--D-glutamate ligase, partial [Planctomycetes bacterium]|nr:UDP-N-acetylmuramoyl-L-alanine--D-glutamate ligase [Planctomycetota bacterium]